MMKSVPAFTLFGDFAATLLAVSLLVFIVVLSPNAQAPGSLIEAQPVAETMPGFHRQVPLGGERAVDFLYALRQPIAGTLVELHRDRVVVVADRQRREIGCSQVDARSFPASGPIRVAVFSAACGAPLFRVLAEGVPRANVLSVPQALKAPTGDDWSDAFKALLAAEVDRSAFAERLARILARASTLRGEGALGGAETRASPSPAENRLVDRLLRWTETLAAIVLVTFGSIVVVIAERRRLRDRQPRSGVR
jgi:hypothetical protein